MDRRKEKELDHLRKRLERVRECIDFIKGEDEKRPTNSEDRGDRIQWLLDRGYV
ncbi:hypothetical protein JQ543_05065 [Bradyrhizobium diazoefficiens]|nr:hypothetical protein [Bradyrhizobium diazoefficiens]MBR0847111.1 hypothetical protein [Bradyrhizobium diazoefficiens]